jgi:GNAT superfamily N-acetyltransferase
MPDPSDPASPQASPPAPDADALEIVDVGTDGLEVVRRLNRRVFDDGQVISTFDHSHLIVLLARVDGAPAGFKVGYRLDDTTYYSAKGGVVDAFRRQGIARALLYEMMALARERGFERFAYDTFPNKHPGMTVLGLDEGFEVVKAGYSPQYQDYRLRFEKEI